MDPQGNLVTLTGALLARGIFRAERDLRGRYALSIAAKRLLRASATVG